MVSLGSATTVMSRRFGACSSVPSVSPCVSPSTFSPPAQPRADPQSRPGNQDRAPRFPKTNYPFGRTSGFPSSASRRAEHPGLCRWRPLLSPCGLAREGQGRLLRCCPNPPLCDTASLVETARENHVGTLCDLISLLQRWHTWHTFLFGQHCSE